VRRNEDLKHGAIVFGLKVREDLRIRGRQQDQAIYPTVKGWTGVGMRPHPFLKNFLQSKESLGPREMEAGTDLLVDLHLTPGVGGGGVERPPSVAWLVKSCEGNWSGVGRAGVDNAARSGGSHKSLQCPIQGD